MRPEARDRAHLEDILEADRGALELLEGVSCEQLVGNKILRLAIEREMTIVGEAARRVSEPLKQAHPEVPWAGMIAFRNVLNHDYGTILADRVWHIVTTQVAPMLESVERLLPPPSGSLPGSRE